MIKLIAAFCNFALA